MSRFLSAVKKKQAKETSNPEQLKRVGALTDNLDSAAEQAEADGKMAEYSYKALRKKRGY